jgi:hypothetical protein
MIMLFLKEETRANGKRKKRKSILTKAAGRRELKNPVSRKKL